MNSISTLQEVKNLNLLESYGGRASFRQKNFDPNLCPKYPIDHFILSGNLGFYKNCSLVDYQGILINLPRLDNLMADVHKDAHEKLKLQLFQTATRREILPEGSQYALLSSSWAEHNTYHAFADVLGRLTHLSKAVDYTKLVYLIPKSAQKFYREIFTALGLSTFLYDENVHYSGYLYVPSLIGDSSFIPYETVKFLRDALNTWLVESETRNFYISRENSSRHISNEIQLINLIRSYIPIEVLHMENLSFLEQIQLIYNSNLTIANHGAGLYSTLFQRAGTVCEIFSPYYAHSCFKNLHTQTGLMYESFISNPDLQLGIRGPQHANPYFVDLDRFERYFCSEILPVLKLPPRV